MAKDININENLIKIFVATGMRPEEAKVLLYMLDVEDDAVVQSYAIRAATGMSQPQISRAFQGHIRRGWIDGIKHLGYIRTKSVRAIKTEILKSYRDVVAMASI